MARVRLVVHKTWLVQNPPADLDAAIERAIRPYGMTASRVGDRIELSGGSSLKVKALGVKLTADADLPRVGTIEHGTVAGESGTERITVHLEERLNSALLDAPAKRSYERVFHGIAASVEAALAGELPEDPSDDDEAGTPAAIGAPGATAETTIRPSEPVVRPAGWWTEVALGTIVKRCGVDGAKLKDLGSLVATEAGVAFTGNPKGGCRWEDLANIEVIEVRDSRGAIRHVRRCVRVSSHAGEVGEFWVSGWTEPKSVYVIYELLHAAD